MTHTRSLWNKDFTLVVLGQIISLFGNAILRFALPLYLLRETGSSTLFGLVTACSFLPMIILSLLGGVLADRVNKRHIMVGLDLGTALLTALVYVLLGRVPTVPLFIFSLMLLYGISGTYQPAVQASIPLLVPPDALMKGNALINQVNTLAGLLGPILGGVLFGLWGIYPLLALSTVCFALSAFMEQFIHIPYTPRRSEQSVGRIIKGDLAESWRYIRQKQPLLLTVALILAAFNFALSPAMIVGIPVMVVSLLHLSDTALGLAQGVLGLGGFAGGLVASVIAPRLGLGRSHYLLGLCALTAALMGWALLLPQAAGYGLILAMCFLTMAASTIFTIQMFTLIQQQTPPELVGKVMAALIAVAMCSQPLGQALYGALFDWWAAFPQLVMFFAALLTLVISMTAKPTFVKLGRLTTKPIKPQVSGFGE